MKAVQPLALTRILEAPGHLEVAGVPEGFDALLLADLAGKAATPVLHIARDAGRAAAMAEALQFFAPGLRLIELPAWDCLPYDRIGPGIEVAARRMAALAQLADGIPAPCLVLTTVNGAVQRLSNPDFVQAGRLPVTAGGSLAREALFTYGAHNGYARVSTVREPGDMAVRGGIVDLYPAGADAPVRLDFFGDNVETIRVFDPESQTTTGTLTELDLLPVSELSLDEAAITRFRRGYIAEFGAVTGDDPLYEAVSAGQRHQGMEHWLALFHEQLVTLFDYLPDAIITLDGLAGVAVDERHREIADYFSARQSVVEDTGDLPAYRALPPDKLYLMETAWKKGLAGRKIRPFSPLNQPPGEGRIDLGGLLARDFAPERRRESANVFDAVAGYLKAQGETGRTVIASYSEGSRERLAGVLEDHDPGPVALAARWEEIDSLPKRTTALIILGLERGFRSDGLTVLSEQDILGDRLVRAGRRRRRAENFLTEATSLMVGDLVVHVEHGIGRYQGLETITAAGAPHDCLALDYAGGSRLYLPVENIELLSRYGSDSPGVQLDRLGGGAWQAKKAKLKERIREIADKLIKTAAERELRHAEISEPPSGLYEEFCARFPYEETEDQTHAIGDVVNDLSAGKPMDRLICGDVGFGKTEVALRATFIAAMESKQVVIVVPTTLLARQHTRTFQERFSGLPLRIAQLSRMVAAKDAQIVRDGLREGQVDIVIGTHALLADAIKFSNLGLLIIDEEQHFGVGHKEKLKELKSDVHVLTLSATPIPRTLQQAMTGVRELSLIATPPIDRLAIRTYIMPVDPVVIREALLREKYRGGQSFFVVPRISDLREIEDFLRTHVPEVKYVIAHGQMAPGALDEVMNAFYDGRHDVLLSTTIVESGLDIPTANTLIIHRADMYGLAQLYQIRGRIGRSKTRAYAYLTTHPRKKLTPNAEKRLKVLQSLDSLGAGFNLASHDLDMRGAGNLIGDEQSGHIREVGFELYQEMLEEAVAALRSGELAVEVDSEWSPQINLGAAVLIPESYVTDLDVRLGLYRRLSGLASRTEIDAFAAEMIDRFGALPDEVEHLFKIVGIKAQCRRAGIAKIDAGPKGLVIQFRKDRFANPAGLVEFITGERGLAKLRPDHRLVLTRNWPTAGERLKGAGALARTLADIASDAKEAA